MSETCGCGFEECWLWNVVRGQRVFECGRVVAFYAQSPQVLPTLPIVTFPSKRLSVVFAEASTWHLACSLSAVFTWGTLAGLRLTVVSIMDLQATQERGRTRSKVREDMARVDDWHSAIST